MRRTNFILDTNLFIRLVTDDIPDQATEAKEIIDFVSQSYGLYDFYIDTTIISEIVFILTKVYKVTRENTSTLLRFITSSQGLKIRSTKKEAYDIAQALYEESSIKWGDAMIVGNMENGDIIVTFDTKHFKKVKGITAVTPKEFIKKYISTK